MFPDWTSLSSAAKSVPARLHSALVYCLKMGGRNPPSSEKVCSSLEEGPPLPSMEELNPRKTGAHTWSY